MRKPHPRSRWLRPELTDRQRQVLTLVNQGLNLTQIAKALGIAVPTVKQHVSYGLAKAELVAERRRERQARDMEAAAMA